jgi:hypothetical protein
MQSYPSTVKEIRFMTTIAKGFHYPVYSNRLILCKSNDNVTETSRLIWSREIGIKCSRSGEKMRAK